MQIGIITAPRTDGTEYLRFTIGQLLTKDTSQEHEIRVFVDAIELPDKRVDHERVTYELASAEQRRRVAEGGVYGTLNFCKALRWSAEGQDIACVFEDDVELARDWAVKALALCEVSRKLAKGYVLTLHHFWRTLADFTTCGSAGGVKLMRRRDPRKFVGGQGLMMPSACAVALADALEKGMLLGQEHRRDYVMDVGVATVTMQQGWGMFTPHPCLLSHVGNVSCVYPGREPLRTWFYVG